MADQAGGLMQFIDPWEITRLVLGIVLVIIGSGLLDHYMKKLSAIIPRSLHGGNVMLLYLG